MTDDRRMPPELEPPAIRGDALAVRLFMDPGLFWFRGHFPVQPIVPGVAQIAWALFYAKRLLPGAELSEVEQIKFTRPILPGETLRLAVSAKETEGGARVRFSCEAETASGLVSCSKGKILLRRSAS